MQWVEFRARTTAGETFIFPMKGIDCIANSRIRPYKAEAPARKVMKDHDLKGELESVTIYRTTTSEKRPKLQLPPSANKPKPKHETDPPWWTYDG